MANNNNIHKLLDKYILSGSNSKDWRENDEYLIELENIRHVLTNELPVTPEHNVTQEQRFAHYTKMAPWRHGRCTLLGSKPSELQKQAPEIWMHLRGIYESKIIRE